MAFKFKKVQLLEQFISCQVIIMKKSALHFLQNCELIFNIEGIIPRCSVILKSLNAEKIGQKSQRGENHFTNPICDKVFSLNKLKLRPTSVGYKKTVLKRFCSELHLAIVTERTRTKSGVVQLFTPNKRLANSYFSLGAVKLDRYL